MGGAVKGQSTLSWIAKLHTLFQKDGDLEVGILQISKPKEVSLPGGGKDSDNCLYPYKKQFRSRNMWPAMPIFELGRAIPVKSRVKIWLRMAEPFKSYRIHKK